MGDVEGLWRRSLLDHITAHYIRYKITKFQARALSSPFQTQRPSYLRLCIYTAGPIFVLYKILVHVILVFLLKVYRSISVDLVIYEVLYDFTLRSM